jgi:hypothetical protein
MYACERKPTTYGPAVRPCSYFFSALTLAHLAFAAALIRARPSGEMWRLGAIETTFCPFRLAHRIPEV